MILSDKYKNELDKIVVSEELKNKILMKTAQRQQENAAKSKASNVFKLRYAVGCAACFVALVATVSSIKEIDENDLKVDKINNSDIGKGNNNSDNKDNNKVGKANNKEDNKDKDSKENKDNDVAKNNENDNINKEKKKADKESQKIENKNANENNLTRTEKAENKGSAVDNAQKTPLIPDSNAEIGEDIVDNSENNVNNIDNENSVTTHNDEEESSNKKVQGNSDFILGSSAIDSSADYEDKAYEEDKSKENDEEESGVESFEASCFGSIEEYATIDEVRKKVGYTFSYPKYMPKGYKSEGIYLLFDNMVEIQYTNGENTISYRTEKTKEDISGDYNIYEKEEKVNIKGKEITLKANGDKYYSAVYIGEKSFAIYSSEALERAELIKILESIK